MTELTPMTEEQKEKDKMEKVEKAEKVDISEIKAEGDIASEISPAIQELSLQDTEVVVDTAPEPGAHKLRISTQRLSTFSDLGESRDSPCKPYPAEQSPYYSSSRLDLSESSRRASRVSQQSSIGDPLKLELAALQFHSSLDYAIVRDFGYPTSDPLFFGARQSISVISSSLEEDEDPAYPPGVGEGPPYYEDSDVDAELESEIQGRAVALFDFEPENDNEIGLFQGQIVWVHYRHGQGWLVAMNLVTEETGLIPEEYVQILGEDEVVSHGLEEEEEEEEGEEEEEDVEEGDTGSPKS